MGWTLTRTVSWIQLTGQFLARTEPTFEGLLVAACAGAIGAFAHMRREGAGAVQGAAIAVALVPPLAAASVLFCQHGLTPALKALLLLAFPTIVGAGERRDGLRAGVWAFTRRRAR